MRKFFRHILLILDGAPVKKRSKRQSGQSVVELAIITPILIVLLCGLVEIGWFANNFLTLLDVARTGARRGATLQDDLTPIAWENNFRASTYMAIEELQPDYQAAGIGVMPYDTSLGAPAQSVQRDTRRRFRLQDQFQNECGPTMPSAYYTEVICLMLRTMEPLTFDASNDVDDMVVSGFAMEMVDPRENDNPGGSPAWLGPNRPVSGDVPQIVVVGRYPANANECDAALDAGGTVVGPLEPRDPFDFNENNGVDVFNGAGLSAPFVSNDDYSEVYGGLQPSTFRWGYDPVVAGTGAEKQVGFVWTGNHRIQNTNCIGSDWTMAEVEDLFNLNDFITDPNQRDLLPGQGMSLVEVFWRHKLLLNLPFFTSLADGAQVYVWAAFPMQSVEPNILFNPPA